MNSSNTYDKNVTKQVLREAIGAHARSQSYRSVGRADGHTLQAFCQIIINRVSTNPGGESESEFVNCPNPFL